MNNLYSNLYINTSDKITDYNLYAVLSSIQNKYPNCSLSVDNYNGNYSIDVNWTLRYIPTENKSLEDFTNQLFDDYSIRYSDNLEAWGNHYVDNKDGTYSFSVRDTIFLDSNETVGETLARISNEEEIFPVYTSLKSIDGVTDSLTFIDPVAFNQDAELFNLGEKVDFYFNKTLESKRSKFYEEFKEKYPMLNPKITINKDGKVTISINNTNFSVNTIDELNEKMSSINVDSLILDPTSASNTLRRKLLEKYPYADINVSINDDKVFITFNGKTIEFNTSSNLDDIIERLNGELSNDGSYNKKYSYNKNIPSYRFYSCINFDDETTYKEIYNFLTGDVLSKTNIYADNIRDIVGNLSHQGFSSSKFKLKKLEESLSTFGDDSKLLGNLIDSMVGIYKTCDKELKDIIDLFLTNDLFKDAQGFDKNNYKRDFEKYIEKWANQLKKDYDKVDSVAAQIKHGYRFSESDYNSIIKENKNYQWNKNDWHIVELPNGKKYYYLNAEVFNKLYNLNDKNTVLDKNHSAYKYINSINLYATTVSVSNELGEFKTRLRRTIKLSPYFKYAIEDDYKKIYDSIINSYDDTNMSKLYKQIIGDDMKTISGCETFFNDDARYMTPSELAMAFYNLKNEYKNFYFLRNVDSNGTVSYLKNVTMSGMVSPQLSYYTDALRESLNERKGISDAIDYVNRVINDGSVSFGELAEMFGSGYEDGLISIPKGLVYLINPDIPNSSKYYKDKYIFDYLRENFKLEDKLDGSLTHQEESLYRLLSTNGISNTGIEGLEIANNMGNVAGQVTTNVVMDLMHVPAPIRLGLRAVGEGGSFAKEVYNEVGDENMARVYGLSDALISFAIASAVDNMQGRQPIIQEHTDPFAKVAVDTRNSMARTIQNLFISNPAKYAVSRVVDEQISSLKSDSFNIYKDYGFDKALQDLRELSDNFNESTSSENLGENLSSGSLFVLKTVLDIMDFD